MDKVIKISLNLLAALLIFLVGVVVGGWKKSDKVRKEVKKAIADVNEEHKKSLKVLEEDIETKFKEKDEIISNLKNIIERLKKYLESVEGPGVARLEKNLNENYERLNKL